MFQIKRLKYKQILSIEELEIEKNQVTCIIGQSGSGKTTLLKMLNHLLSPDEGEIYYKGRSVFEWDPIRLRREVVMLSQQPIVFAGNIRENLNIGRIFAEKKQCDDHYLIQALKLVKLEKKLEEDADSLSGGEKQRLSLARVFLMEPDVFLLDEPTSALDKGTEDEVMNSFLTEASKKGKTVVMVTHSVEMAETYADKIIQIQK